MQNPIARIAQSHNISIRDLAILLHLPPASLYSTNLGYRQKLSPKMAKSLASFAGEDSEILKLEYQLYLEGESEIIAHKLHSQPTI